MGSNELCSEPSSALRCPLKEISVLNRRQILSLFLVEVDRICMYLFFCKVSVGLRFDTKLLNYIGVTFSFIASKFIPA